MADGRGGTDRDADHDATPLTPGTVLEGKYRVERRLGAGGMGLVYEATHLALRKSVAIKVLHPSLAGRQDMVARVLREARAASATGHPNVVTVTDLGWTAGAPFIVMELLEGETLDELLSREGPLPLPRAASIVCDVLDALQAVHEVRVVHRDLKPSNVMLVPGRRGEQVVKLLDFGVSKLAQGEPGDDLTQPGKLIGTPRHMAPEQILAEENIDHRADVHAAGSLLYALLVGRSPFLGRTATATMARVLDGKYEPASRRVPGLPSMLDEVIDRALAVDPSGRFEDADSMRRALLPFASSQRSDDSPSADEAGPPAVSVDDSHVGPIAQTEIGAPRNTTEAWPSAGGRRPQVRSGQVLPVTDPSLELDVPRGWQPGEPEPSTKASRPRRPSNIPWGPIVVELLLVGAGAALWNWRGDLGGMFGGSDEGHGEKILLLVDTKPKDAIIFVDDVQRNERPIELPKSEDYVRVRVEAKGYEPRTVQVQPKRTRRLEVKLHRAKR